MDHLSLIRAATGTLIDHVDELTQLDSAALALQNLKLDLLKLRSAGVSAAINGEMSATQEARSVSKDIGRIMEVADDLRDI